jgi:hypothetical protein
MRQLTDAGCGEVRTARGDGTMFELLYLSFRIKQDTVKPCTRF